MENKEFRAIVEAVLFACGSPVDSDKIAEALKIEKKQCEDWLAEFVTDFNAAHSGIKVVKLNDSYQMCSREEHAQYIIKIMNMRKNVPLSQAAMEVLAIIAYNEPVTKAFIEQVRGVDCTGVVSSLANKGLIEERGRLELPGRPLLYGTTENFLRCFGITSTLELPPVQDKEEDEQEDTQDKQNAENTDVETVADKSIAEDIAATAADIEDVINNDSYYEEYDEEFDEVDETIYELFSDDSEKDEGSFDENE